MANRIFLPVLLIIYILNVGNGYYYHWYTTDRMKSKFLFMKRELVMDAIRNVQRIDHIKDYYTMSTVYDIGQMLYFIRSKFARMVRLLILTIENKDKYKTFHEMLPNFKETHHLSLDIYHLIEMLEEYELTSDQRSSELQRLKKKRFMKKPPNITEHILKSISKKNKTIPKSLRKKSIDIPSFAKRHFYTSNPNGAVRNRMKVNQETDFDAAFESEFE